MSRENGKQLYELYCNEIGWKNYQGLPCPEFVNLPENIQEAWQKAALGYEIILAYEEREAQSEKDRLPISGQTKS